MIMIGFAGNSNAQGGAHAHSILLSWSWSWPRPLRRARPLLRRHAGIRPATAAARCDAVAADAQHADVAGSAKTEGHRRSALCGGARQSSIGAAQAAEGF